MSHIKKFYSFEMINEGAKFDFMKHYSFIKKLEKKYDLNIFLEKSTVNIFNNCIIEFNNVYRDWDYKNKKPIKFRKIIDECNIDTYFSDKEGIIRMVEEEIEFHKNVRLNKTNEELSTFQQILLNAGAAICIYKFCKGLVNDIFDRNAERIVGKATQWDIQLLARRVGEKIEDGGKIEFSEDFRYYKFNLKDLVIIIDKQKNELTWSDPNGKIGHNTKISKEEIDELILSIKEENNE